MVKVNSRFISAQAKLEEKRFLREDIIHSKRFTMRERDFLAILLVKPDYTLTEVEDLIKAEMERVIE